MSDKGESIVGLYNDLTVELFELAELVRERLGTKVLIIGLAGSVLSIGKVWRLGTWLGRGQWEFVSWRWCCPWTW